MIHFRRGQVQGNIGAFAYASIVHRSGRVGCIRKSSTSSANPETAYPQRKSSKSPINNAFPITVLVMVDQEISRFKSFKKSTRKVYLPKLIESPNVSLARNLIDSTFPDLRGEEYLVGYSIPQHSKKGNAGNALSITPILSDDNVHDALCEARDTVLPIHLHVRRNPGVFPPVADGKKDRLHYLIGMPSPDLLTSYTMLSFYKFKEFSNPEKVVSELREFLLPFGALGRIYVAHEGINAQMAIPTNVLPHFQIACNESELFLDHNVEVNEGLFLNVDHIVTKSDFAKNKPFSGLRITLREQIVADGLKNYASDSISPTAVDSDGNNSNSNVGSDISWNDRGKELSPIDWHNAIENAADNKAIILDCRNSYESDVGKFKDAVPLNTLFFRESWDALDELLSNKPKDTPILTYCTGGIRCVKINAYLKQKQGFQDVSSLKGGIINYAKVIEKSNISNESITSKTIKSSDESILGSNTATMDHRHIENSKFTGINYVFDERMGTRITSDQLASCETCGKCKCDSFCNCLNPTCHIRFIQCKNCNLMYGGCCSKYCQAELANYLDLKSKKEEENRMIREHNMSVKVNKLKDKSILKYSNNTLSSFINNNLTISREFSTSVAAAPLIKPPHAINESNDHSFTYADKHSSRLPAHLTQLYKKTIEVYSADVAGRLCTSESQGRLLSMIASIKQPNRVLELGTFTGYGTLSLLEGMLRSSGKFSGERAILTCDIDSKALTLANEAFEDARRLNAQSNIMIKSHAKSASDMISFAKENNLMFDLVYLDGDKKNYKRYLMDMLGSLDNHPILNDGAVILVDNTLWKGLVSIFDQDPVDISTVGVNVNGPIASDRYLKIAKHMHDFNCFVRESANLKQVILPIRDGISVIQYQKA